MKNFNLITVIISILVIMIPKQSLADIGGLTKCSESPAFEKRLKSSIKRLEQRVSKYETETPPALALEQQIQRTKARLGWTKISTSNKYG